jgi:hypothetical protein
VSLPGLADTGTTTPQPNEVQFISPSEGYVAVQETGAGSTRTHYFRTTDGGRTWSEVALVQRQTAWTAPIFLDSQHWFQAGLQNMVVPKAGATDEFVVTPGMNVTSDGGKTWRNVGASMGSLDVVWMSDTLHGATLVGDGPGSHLFLTSDGGETWQAAKIGPAQWPTPSVELVTVPPSGSGVPGASLETAQPANPSIPVVAFPPVESGMPGVAASQAPPFSPPA